MMWPILALSVMSLALILERGVYLATLARRNRLLTSSLRGARNPSRIGYPRLRENLAGTDPQTAERRIEEVVQLEFDRAENVLALDRHLRPEVPVAGFRPAWCVGRSRYNGR
jgi:biopolymer transport protein ExbB/TolQ